MGTGKITYDFMLTAADEILANAPAMIALAKAEALGQLWEADLPEVDVPLYLKPFEQIDQATTVTVRNEQAEQAFEEMIRAATALAAAREKHLYAQRTMNDLVDGMLGRRRS